MPHLSRRQAIHLLTAAGTAIILPACATASSSRPAAKSPSPTARSAPLPRQFRAAWVATVDNIDWPTKPALPVETQRREIQHILDVAEQTGLNAIILQVRPTADALYNSRLEPWSAFLTGQQGRPPEPAYDPLVDWVTGAHARGLDLHAWVNPYRSRHPKSIGPDAANHLNNTRPDLAKPYGPYRWIDPGHPDAADTINRIVDDLLARYDLDGIHMDDYFYPYPRENTPFPDEDTYAINRRDGGTLERDEWRRENINTLVRSLGQRVHERKPGAIFTVSPFGIWRPNNPPGIKGFDAYAGLYADSRRWLNRGWVDALMPQLYWPIESEGQPFEPLLNWWASENAAGRHLWPGLYLTRIQPAGSTDKSWEPDQIRRQIEIIDAHPNADGFALFSMKGLTENRRAIRTELARSPLAKPAFTPESPWAGGTRPGQPTARRVGQTLRIRPDTLKGPTRRYAIQWQQAGQTTTAALPAQEDQDAIFRLPSEAIIAGRVTITPTGPNGLAGAPTTITL